MPEHGGDRLAAARRWGIPPDDWLDLSTGINPHPWPLPPLPVALCQRLPADDDRLEAAARERFGVRHLLAVPGSQAAIAWLPRLRARARVGVVSPTYAEHAHHWRLAGHAVRPLPPAAVDASLDMLDVLVMVRPNNPDGLCLPREQVLDWWRRLRDRDGWLVVDEAFVEAEPAISLAACAEEAGFIVLRSFGKFFGLPGLRLGFVLAHPSVLAPLREALGPWPVSSITRFWGEQALRDTAWQEEARKRLLGGSRRLEALLGRHGLVPEGGTAFYRYLRHPDAEAIHEALASLGILVRLFPGEEGGGALRFGLPGDEADWQRLEQGLEIIGE